MTEINVGDTVRLSVQGVVTEINGDFVTVGGGYRFLPNYSIEILKRAEKPLKVGETIPADEIGRLPVGSLYVRNG